MGDPFPNVRREPPPPERAVQALWIDVASFLPLRWDTPMYSYAFGYDPALTIARPDGVTPPACVP